MKKLLCLITLMTIGCCFTGCDFNQGKIQDTKNHYGTMLNADTSLNQLTMPFWRMNTMYNESVTMIERNDDAINAKMLFTPVRIISVQDVTLKKTYVEGKDYTWDKKSNTLVWIEGSEIEYFTQNDIHGKNEKGRYINAFDGTDNSWDAEGRSRFGDALYSVGAFLYEKQIAVTYEYKYEDWQGSITKYQGDRLPKTINKLKNGEDVKVVFYGDSIFAGCDASSIYNREPNQPIFSELVKSSLGEYYNSNITLLNPSVGGIDSAWGAANAKSNVADTKPDLVVIGFGMNDGARSGVDVAMNIKYIMDEIKKQQPDCEFIVVTPMVANSEAGFLLSQPTYPAEYVKLAGDGVAYVDMFSIHSDILKVKDFIATSGNNVNHPNDWLIRVYAMNVLSTLVEY